MGEHRAHEQRGHAGYHEQAKTPGLFFTGAAVPLLQYELRTAGLDRAARYGRGFRQLGARPYLRTGGNGRHVFLYRGGLCFIGHTSRRGAYQPNFLDGVLGDKGVYSTAEDLLRFDLALRNGFLLDASWQAKAYTNYTDEVHPYGWGWRLDEYQGHRIVYHNGWWHGYKGRFLRLPQEDTTIIVLENQARSSFSVEALMNLSKKLFDLPDRSDQEEETGKMADLDAEEKG